MAESSRRDNGMKYVYSKLGRLNRISEFISLPDPKEVYRWTSFKEEYVLGFCERAAKSGCMLEPSRIRPDKWPPEVYGGQIPYEAAPGIYVIEPKPEFSRKRSRGSKQDPRAH